MEVLDKNGLIFYNSQLNTKFNNKVDKENGKGLSTNDFTDAYEADVISNTQARHTHTNKSVLDDITQTDVDNWNNNVGAILSSEKGVANGVATLDNQGKVPLAQLYDSVLGNLYFNGFYDASTGHLTILEQNRGDRSGSLLRVGDYFICWKKATPPPSLLPNVDDPISGAGSSVPNLTFEVGDWLIYTGLNIGGENYYPQVNELMSGPWAKVDNTDAVASVNGKTGVVIISAADVQAVPLTRTINNKALSDNINLTQDDIPNGTTYVRVTQSEKDSWNSVPSITVDPAPTENSTNAVASGGVYTALQGYVPVTRKINDKPLSKDISLTPDDLDITVLTNAEIQAILDGTV